MSGFCPPKCTCWNCCICPYACALESVRQCLICCAGCCPCCGYCCANCAETCCPSPGACYQSDDGDAHGVLLGGERRRVQHARGWRHRYKAGWAG